MARARQRRPPPAGFLSPAVRQLLTQHAVDLSSLHGTGTSGRITVSDVRARSCDITGQAHSTIPFDPMRRRAAANLRRSRDTIPHEWIARPADYTAVDAVRRDAGLTALPFVARAVIGALAASPTLCVTVVDDELVPAASIGLGIAVDLDHHGLVVPVIHRAEDLRLRALAHRIAQLARRARDRGLAPDDVTGGTFTITNPGSAGTYLSVPVIPPPTVAILSTDGVSSRVVADTRGRLDVRRIGMLGLSYDARAVTRDEAARFLAQVAAAIARRRWADEL